MKYLYILLILFSSNYFLQEVTLSGNYSMYYEEKYHDQNCEITFKGNSYERILPNGKKIKGLVEYKDFTIILKEKNTSLEMVVFKRTMSEDTIKFMTRNISKEYKPDGDIVFPKGMLVKIK